MVTFTTDPRIAYARARQQAGMKRAMTLPELPRNPYGGSPIWGNVQRLADAFGSRMLGADAVRLQKEQKTAQNLVLANILRAGGAAPPPGGSYFEQINRRIPESATGMPPPPSVVETQLRRKEIGDDGRADFSPVSAEIAETAGIDPLQLKLLYDKARLEGNVATEKAIEREAQRGMAKAAAEENWPLVEQWGNILDPTAGLERKLKKQTLLEERIYEKTQKLEEIRQRKIDAEAAGDRTLAAALAREARTLERTIEGERRTLERTIEAESRRADRDKEKFLRTDVTRWTPEGLEVRISREAWEIDQALTEDQQKYTNIKPRKPADPIRVELVTPVGDRTTAFVTPEVLAEDMKLPFEEQLYKPLAGASIDRDGNLVFTGAPDIGKVPRQKQTEIGIALAFQQARASALLKNLIETPGLAGLRAKFADVIGGYLGQGNAEAGEILTHWIAGASADELATFKFEGNALIAGLIPELSGEQTGRFSGPERTITEEAQRVFETSSSPKLLEGAFRAALRAYAVHGAKANYLVGRRYRIKDKEWLIPYVKSLFGMGLNEKDVKSILQSIKTAHEVMDTYPDAASTR